MRHAPQTDPSAQLVRWLGLIRAEYQELPGLCLTLPQARRFWGLDEASSTALFARLVDMGFLRQTRAGAFVRTDIG